MITHRWIRAKLKWEAHPNDVLIKKEVSKGLGLLGTIWHVTLGSRSFILKRSPPKDSIWFDYLSVIEPYKREAYAYRYLQNYRAALIDNIPEYYWSSWSRNGSGGIAIEDLIAKGASVFGTRTALPLSYCKSSLSSIARIHSLYPFLNREFKKGVPRTWMFTGTSPALIAIIKAALIRTKSLMENELRAYFYGTDLTILNNLPVDKILYNTHFNSRLSTFCHGDFWSNNIMFVKKDGRRKINAIIIDWQFATWGNPLIDLTFLFFSALDSATVSRYSQSLVRYYYDELSAALKNDLSYSLEDCLADYQQAVNYGIVMTLANLEAFISGGDDSLTAPLITRFKSLVAAAEMIIEKNADFKK